MKVFTSVLFLLMLSVSFGQENFEITNDALETLFDAIATKDTLIKNRTKYYKCSEDMSGRIEAYYLDEKLVLITHIYKQGLGNDMFLEHYFIQKDTLRIKTSISEIQHLNTKYTKNSRGTSTMSAERVLQVTEQRMFFSAMDIPTCFERKHMEKRSSWDQDYFNTLTFKVANCTESYEDIRYKYRLMIKAEKKLENYGNRKPGCIFHMW